MAAGASSTALVALINRIANNGAQPQWGFLLVAFVSLILVRSLAGAISKFLLFRFAQGVVFQLRLALSRRILQAPLHRFEQIGVPRLLAALTDDIVTLSETFGAIPILCIDASIVAGCILYLGWLSPRLLVLMLIFILFGVISYRWLANKGLQRLVLARENENMLFEHLRAMTDGLKELKLNAARQEEFFHDHLPGSAEAFRFQNVQAVRMFALADGWGEMLFFLPVGLVLFLPAQLGVFSQEVLWGYIIVVIFLIGPLSNIVNLLPRLGRAYVAIANINSIESALAYEHEQDPDSKGPDPNVTTWELKLVDISHSYIGAEKETEFRVGPVNLTLHPGELVFITGGNGSGKSTLAKLITGLYTPDNGEIVFNRIEVRGENKTWYRQHFSAIFADYYVFPRLMGIDQEIAASKTEIYLKWLGLRGKVHVRDGRFSTTQLSSGQRRRLAMLHALLEDRPIYVFDEWAADQDAEFRCMFYEDLLPALKERQKGIVVITHDERYFAKADRIIKMEYGKVVLDERSTQKDEWQGLAPAGEKFHKGLV